jgi:hypothetical protein
MKNEHEEDNELLIAWLKADARLADDALEQKIMSRIVQPPVLVRKPVKIPHALIVTGYCMLTFIMLVVCFWNRDMIMSVQLFESGWQSVPADEIDKYNVVILVSMLLAALSFISYWQLSKKKKFQYD